MQIPFLNIEKSDKIFTQKELDDAVYTACVETEDKILRNLNLSALFDDLEPPSTLAKFLPYLSFIVSIITLILLVAK